MNGIVRKRFSPHSPLVVGCALLWGFVEVVALSRARWVQRRNGRTLRVNPRD